MNKDLFQIGKTGLLLSMAVFLGIFASTAWADPIGKVKLEDVLPQKDTVLFAKCSGIEQLKNDGRTLELVKLFNEPEMEAFFAKALAMGKQEIRKNQRGDMGFPVKEIWGLLKGEFAIACSSRFTLTHEGPFPLLAFGMDMGENKEAFMKTLHGFMDMGASRSGMQQKQITYKEFKVHQVGWPGKRLSICYTTIHNLFVATINHHYLKTIIDNYTNERPGLSSLPSYKTCVEKVGGQKAGMLFYLNIQPLLQAIEPFCPYEVMDALEDLGLVNVKAFCLGSVIENGACRDSLFVDCPGEKKGLFKMLHPHPISWDNLKLAPPDALYFMDMAFDPKLILTEVETLVKKHAPEIYGQYSQHQGYMREALGFNPVNELIRPLGDEIVFFVTMPQGELLPHVFLCVDLDDPEAFKGFLDKMVAMPELRLNASDTAYEGLTIRHFTLPVHEAPFAPAYTIENKTLIVSSTPMALKKYLRWKKSGKPGLGDSEQFKSVAASAPKNTTAFEFYNLNKGVALGYNMGQPFIVNLLSSETNGLLDGALLPMTETITDHITNGIGYCSIDEQGMLMGGTCPIGVSTVLAAGALLADYAIQENLVAGMLSQPRVKAFKRVNRVSYERGVELMRDQRCEEAEKIFDQWLSHNMNHPKLFKAYLNRGYCRLYLRRYDAAISDYTLVAAKSKEAYDLRYAYYNLACAYSLKGEKDKALACMEKSIENMWTDLNAINNDPDLDNIRDMEGFKKLTERIKKNK